jgi:hypothetical protein
MDALPNLFALHQDGARWTLVAPTADPVRPAYHWRTLTAPGMAGDSVGLSGSYAMAGMRGLNAPEIPLSKP